MNEANNRLNDIHNEFKDKFKANQEMIEKKRKRIDFIINLLFFISISMMILAPSIIRDNSNAFYLKRIVQGNVKKAISNNADINILGDILNNSEKILKIKEKDNEYYPKSISLENVLKDIQVQNYLSDEFDQRLDEKISDYIGESKKINPLKELSNNQKEYFLNIKNKLDDSSYFKIENDLNKIVDELSSKNKLVEIYLDNSDISFKLTVLSFILGLIALLPLAKSLISFIVIKLKKAD